MKVVSIGRNLILKEVGRQVDRLKNTIQVQLAIEPCYITAVELREV